MPRVVKTTWTKESAVLLINIVKDVERKVLNKELQVGKENEKTKWDYVADWLHEVSQKDATKTSTNCQYKFWELNRHYKFLLKESDGKTITEEKDGAMYAALKDYYDLFPPVKKKSKKLQQGSKESRDIHAREAAKGGSGKNIEEFQETMNTQPKQAYHHFPRSDTGPQSGEDGCNPEHRFSSEPVTKTALPGQFLNQTGDITGRSFLYREKVEPVMQLDNMSSNANWCEKSRKRKAQGLDDRDPDHKREDQDSSSRLKQMVDKMARLTSYLEWKHTGIGEDWRCHVTDHIESHQKRDTSELIHKPGQPQDEKGVLVPDEIECALREDILSFWNALDDKRPTEEECQRYFQNLKAVDFIHHR